MMRSVRMSAPKNEKTGAKVRGLFDELLIASHHQSPVRNEERAMIPAIGLVVCAYVFLRCLEIVATTNETRIPSQGSRVVLICFAAGVMILSVVSAADLVLSSTNFSDQFKLFNPPTAANPTKLSPDEYRRQKQAADAEAERILREIEQRQKR
jgi:hypothetical protein